MCLNTVSIAYPDWVIEGKPGLLPGLGAPVMTPNGVDFSFLFLLKAIFQADRTQAGTHVLQICENLYFIAHACPVACSFLEHAVLPEMGHLHLLCLLAVCGHLLCILPGP